LTEATTRLIALDWGTTRLRAYRLGEGGRVLERRSREAGILKVPNGDFAGTLEGTAGDWLAAAPEAPVIAAGMIGSRQGWSEVPYVACPAGLAEIAAGLGRVALPDGRAVHLMPGLVLPGAADGFPDVMRGEETQILGLLAAQPDEAARRCFVLPGTHSKWAWTEGRSIVRFATYMTGELFELATKHGILGRLMTGTEPEPEAFARGLARAAAARHTPPGRLLHELFSARTLALFGELPGEAVAGYLSGLLIGSEVAAALAEEEAVESVTIVAGGELADLYARALRSAAVAAEVADADAAAAGLHAVARAAGFLQEQPDA
jgi:2-dehydro-3-deoxygalactonokinase